MSKILIIDDETDIVEMLEMKFKENGFEVITARDGQEGLSKAKETVPDLIIVDEMMPKMDGYHFSGFLKSDTRFKGIPVIMFTARAEEPEENMSKEAGINAYLTKMADFETLLAKVQQLINQGREE